MYKNSNRYKLFISLIFTIFNTNHLLINIFVKFNDDKILPFLLEPN
jgi:hypothetical protein